MKKIIIIFGLVLVMASGAFAVNVETKSTEVFIEQVSQNSIENEEGDIETMINILKEYCSTQSAEICLNGEAFTLSRTCCASTQAMATIKASNQLSAAIATIYTAIYEK